jgi:hypothetical protein
MLQRYGERQAQEWLDLARYADTGGYQNDMPHKVWKWRQWLINAYNANMPFDHRRAAGRSPARLDRRRRGGRRARRADGSACRPRYLQG